MAMEDGMDTMFPNGIRTLLVDDDPKFLKSAKELLSFLNFEVVVCSNVAHALKSLTSGHHEGFDVILVHAAKAAAAGFDFRAIIEANLLIPVIYFLPQGHKAIGDEGTNVIKKPVDANEVRNLLWKVITSRKCELETKARRDIQQGVEDEDRVQQGGRKRMCSSSPTGGSFFFAGTAAAGGHPTAKGKEKDNVASLQQPQPAQQKAAVMNGPHLNFFMNAAMTPFKPSFFSVVDGPSGNAGTFAGAVYSATPSAFPQAVAPNMATAASIIYKPQFSQVIGNQQQQDVHPQLMFGSFPYQGPSPLAGEGGLFTACSITSGASVAAAAGSAEARAYDNNVNFPFLQPLNQGAEQDADGEPAMAPQPFFSGAIDKATMEWLLSDDFDDYVSGAPPLVEPNNNQVLGKASNIEEPTTTARSTNGASSSMALQEDIAGNNGDQVAWEDIIHGSLLGSDQGEGADTMMDKNHAGLAVSAMPLFDDQDEDNTSVPHNALLRDMYGPLFEFDDIVDIDFMLGALIDGGAAIADYGDDAGTLLHTGEEGGSNMDGLGNLDDLEIPYDLLENFLVPCHNNRNNVHK